MRRERSRTGGVGVLCWRCGWPQYGRRLTLFTDIAEPVVAPLPAVPTVARRGNPVAALPSRGRRDRVDTHWKNPSTCPRPRVRVRVDITAVGCSGICTSDRSDGPGLSRGPPVRAADASLGRSRRRVAGGSGRRAVAGVRAPERIAGLPRAAGAIRGPAGGARRNRMRRHPGHARRSHGWPPG